jgi:uncharacterized protein YuzE
MKITYDPQNDRLHILLRNVPIEYSRTEKSGLVFDYDDADRVVGLEIPEASHQMYDPRSVEFQEREAVSPSPAVGRVVALGTQAEK